MNARAISCWDQAGAEADLTITLPGGAPMFFRRIPKSPEAGFRMGSRGISPSEEPVHRVVIPEDFYLATFVVTQEQYEAVAGAVPALQGRANPSGFKGPRLPVENVNWREANCFCDWLRSNTSARELPPEGYELFCLPTEAEWEYACRAGTDTDFHKGDGEAALAEVGWYYGNSGYETHPVDEEVAGHAECHPFRLRGMHGNVEEWCHDLWDGAAYRGRVERGLDPGLSSRLAEWGNGLARPNDAEDNRLRVIRGGSWGGSAGRCQSAYCNRWRPDDGIGIIGFRVCLVRGPTGHGGAAEQPSQAEATRAPGVGGRGTGPQTDGAGGAGAAGSVDLAQTLFYGAAGREFLAEPRPE